MLLWILIFKPDAYFHYFNYLHILLHSEIIIFVITAKIFSSKILIVVSQYLPKLRYVFILNICLGDKK